MKEFGRRTSHSAGTEMHISMIKSEADFIEQKKNVTEISCHE